MRTYEVIESFKGHTVWHVKAENAQEAKDTYMQGEAIDSRAEPAGVHHVRWAREEDE